MCNDPSKLLNAQCLFSSAMHDQVAIGAHGDQVVDGIQYVLYLQQMQRMGMVNGHRMFSQYAISKFQIDIAHSTQLTLNPYALGPRHWVMLVPVHLDGHRMGAIRIFRVHLVRRSFKNKVHLTLTTPLTGNDLQQG